MFSRAHAWVLFAAASITNSGDRYIAAEKADFLLKKFDERFQNHNVKGWVDRETEESTSHV
jgi:hypothetical protein